jgi:hypothetical protein
MQIWIGKLSVFLLLKVGNGDRQCNDNDATRVAETEGLDLAFSQLMNSVHSSDTVDSSSVLKALMKIMHQHCDNMEVSEAAINAMVL